MVGVRIWDGLDIVNKLVMVKIWVGLARKGFCKWLFREVPAVEIRINSQLVMVPFKKHV